MSNELLTKIAKESTSQEIKQAVENIEVQVNETSGVIVGTNGKKYRAIMKDSLAIANPRANNVAQTSNIRYELDDVIVMLRQTSTIGILNKTTLEYSTTDINGYVSGFVADMTFMTGLASAAVVANDRWLLVVYNYQTGGTNAQVLGIFDRYDGYKYKKHLYIYDTASDQATGAKMWINGDDLYMTKNNTYSILYKFSVNALVTLSANNFRMDTGVAVKDFTSFDQYGKYIKGIHFDTPNNAVFVSLGTHSIAPSATTIVKCDLNWNTIAQAKYTPTTNLNNSYTFFYENGNNELYLVTNSAMLILEKDVMTITVVDTTEVSPNGANTLSIDENGDMVIMLASAGNTYDGVLVKTYRTISNKMSIINVTTIETDTQIYTAALNFLMTNIDNKPYLFLFNPMKVVYEVISTSRIVDYKEVIE